jgi:cell wall-associated NlpC family hydrolase
MIMIESSRIITEAKKLVGIPFCHYGRTTLGLDCSGLIWLSHTRSGMNLPRVDSHYYPLWWRDKHQGERLVEGLINTWKFELCEEPVQSGLVLFRIWGRKYPIHHCGILLDDDKFIHAKSTLGKGSSKVTIECLSQGYKRLIAGYMMHREINYNGNDNRTACW